jgi:hypothetical protein
MSLHIYAERLQPATRYIDPHLEPPLRFLRSPHRSVWCSCCKRKRQARNAVVQVYYDATVFWCAAGKGCKDPKVIRQRERQMRQRRSAGQKARWAKARKERKP